MEDKIININFRYKDLLEQLLDAQMEASMKLLPEDKREFIFLVSHKDWDLIRDKFNEISVIAVNGNESIKENELKAYGYCGFKTTFKIKE